MPEIHVELLTIGTELLLGQTADTNSRVIALGLQDSGLSLTRITTVADDKKEIAATIRQAIGRAPVLLITGGLGPTVDDPTREAVAEAAHVELEFHPDLWSAIQVRFQKSNRAASENNRLQAFLPAGAIPLANPVGSAPGFALEIGNSIVLAMPGVPAEMEVMLKGEILPLLRARLKERGVLLIRFLHVGGLGESQIDERMGEWERSANPVVGLAAHSGLVVVRIAARGSDDADAARILRRAEDDIRAKLAGYIFGTDDDTLAGIVLGSLPPGMRVKTLESGTGGFLAGQFELCHHPAFLGGQILPEAEQFYEALEKERSIRNSDLLLAIRISKTADLFEVETIFEGPDKKSSEKRSYAMASSTIPEWAADHLLFRFWQALQKHP